MAVIDTSRLVVSNDVDHTASGLGADKSGARRGRGRPWVGSLSDATSPESTMYPLISAPATASKTQLWFASVT